MSMRLRQVAMVGTEYDEVEAQLRDGLGLGVAYRDPGHRPAHEAGVSIFGLRNFVMAVGNQFLELVCPLADQPDTAGGRYIERRGGPGGYMLLFQVPEGAFAGHRQRIEALGVRIVAAEEIEADGTGAIHLHPKDLPGCIAELRWCENEDAADGDWWPVERDWRDHRCTEVVSGICGAEIQADDPVGLSARWADVLDLAVDDVDGVPTVAVDDAVIRFVHGTDGRPEGLGAIDLATDDVAGAVTRARAAGIEVHGHTLMINGLRMHLVAGN